MKIDGKVIKGNGLGRTMGFPTVNVGYRGEEKGVFAGKVLLKGKEYISAIHIGERPTIGDPIYSCEAYIIGFDGDIQVGTPISIITEKKIRDYKKFQDLKELKEQIAKDVEFVENWYKLSR